MLAALLSGILTSCVQAYVYSILETRTAWVSLGCAVEKEELQTYLLTCQKSLTTIRINAFTHAFLAAGYIREQDFSDCEIVHGTEPGVQIILYTVMIAQANYNITTGNYPTYSELLKKAAAWMPDDEMKNSGKISMRDLVKF